MGWMQIPYVTYSDVVWINKILSVRVLHHKVGKIYIQVWDYWFLCFVSFSLENLLLKS